MICAACCYVRNGEDKVTQKRHFQVFNALKNAEQNYLQGSGVNLRPGDYSGWIEVLNQVDSNSLFLNLLDTPVQVETPVAVEQPVVQPVIQQVVQPVVQPVEVIPRASVLSPTRIIASPRRIIANPTSTILSPSRVIANPTSKLHELTI